jgi:hypothetical protein
VVSSNAGGRDLAGILIQHEETMEDSKGNRMIDV